MKMIRSVITPFCDATFGNNIHNIHKTLSFTFICKMQMLCKIYISHGFVRKHDFWYSQAVSTPTRMFTKMKKMHSLEDSITDSLRLFISV